MVTIRPPIHLGANLKHQYISWLKLHASTTLHSSGGTVCANGCIVKTVETQLLENRLHNCKKNGVKSITESYMERQLSAMPSSTLESGT